jgi:hypothetical protein
VATAIKTQSTRRGTFVAGTVTAVALIAIGFVVWSTLVTRGFGTEASALLPWLSFLVAMLAFVISGAMIVSRQPGNIIGWLLITPGSVAVGELIHQWLVSLDPPPTSADLAVWLGVWFDNWSWILLIYPIFHLLLVFPTGRVLSRRWRWVVGVELGMALFMVLGVTFSDSLGVSADTEDEVTLWSVENPIGFIPEGFFGSAFVLVWTVGLLFLTVVGVTAIVLRFRSGSGLARQQLKWPLYAIALFGLVYGWIAIFGGPDTGPIANSLFGLSLVAIPVSVAIAVLRYRLYDLDRIVSRTVTYLVLAGLLVSAYWLVVLGLGSFFGQDNPVAVAAATLAAAALFNPVRTRIRRWVDRRFNRPRYDTERVIDEFTATLRDRVDPEGVVEGWVGVVSETMQPTAVGAWIRR